MRSIEASKDRLVQDIGTHGLGASWLGQNVCQFRVWAPFAASMTVELVAPHSRTAEMDAIGDGYFQATLGEVAAGSLYYYHLDVHVRRPDPASRSQPQGVHGPSEVLENWFPWEDADWKGLPIEQYVLYELHVGTFTPEGTFDAIIPHLDGLKALGVTAIELMPVSPFPGSRNWGYDGVYPYAVHSGYGGPQGLKRLTDVCHNKGLAVVLDVVYNHLGPEGNYLNDFGPYFTDRHHTPWGRAFNFDGEDSVPVRAFFVQNALEWVTEFHVDGLRLDAVHAMFDQSGNHILTEITERVHARAKVLERSVQVIAESDLNDVRLIEPHSRGGCEMDAQWSDDFHHALHVTLTGEQDGYYGDYKGGADLRKAFAEGFVYSGQYSKHRKRFHGTPSQTLPLSRFVVFSQNHDQAGNRFLGERLSQLVGFEGLKLAASCVILSPYIPLLFMGEEYGETAPFQYFVSHGDERLIEAVRSGRLEEFRSFHFSGEAPDPQAVGTFLHSKLNHALSSEGRHAILLRYYKELLRLRRNTPALAFLSRRDMDVTAIENDNVLMIRRRAQPDSDCVVLFCLSGEPATVSCPLPNGRWYKVLDSGERRWEGPGSAVPQTLESEGTVPLVLSPHGCCLLGRETEDAPR